MEIKVLGSAGSETPGHNPPAFLIDDFLLLDAGTITTSLDKDAQCDITHIFLTHAHLDHIKGIPFLVDNIVSSGRNCPLTILSGREVLADLKRNIFNNRIWPDFSTIPSGAPVIRYRQISTRGHTEVGGYNLYATKVNHTVPCYGFMVENSSKDAIVYTGDTGPTEKIWKRMGRHRVKALIIEVSFPDKLMDLALISGHLTPSLLEEEIRKMPNVPEQIYITHIKPYYRSIIEEELRRPGLGKFNLQPLHSNMVISI